MHIAIRSLLFGILTFVIMMIILGISMFFQSAEGKAGSVLIMFAYVSTAYVPILAAITSYLIGKALEM